VSRDSKHRKKRRRARNKQAQAQQLAPSVGAPRVRRSFSAKARSGDEVVVAFEFSGVEVPFDPSAEDPSADVARAHAAVEAWDDAGNPTTGSA
jgi:hypothetical protein